MRERERLRQRQRQREEQQLLVLITQLRTASIRHVVPHLWASLGLRFVLFIRFSFFLLFFVLSAKRFINVTSINKQAAVEKFRKRETDRERGSALCG